MMATFLAAHPSCAMEAARPMPHATAANPSRQCRTGWPFRLECRISAQEILWAIYTITPTLLGFPEIKALAPATDSTQLLRTTALGRRIQLIPGRMVLEVVHPRSHAASSAAIRPPSSTATGSSPAAAARTPEPPSTTS